MHFVYVLFSQADRKLYVGYSMDVVARLKQHSAGEVISTKDRRPLKLVYYEAYLNPLEAKRREKYLKGGNGRSELKKQLFSTLKELKYKCL